mgnify:CR=1 FL=1
MTDITPHRVKLERRKGWRMPENTVKVDRTMPFGNPYQAGTDGDGDRQMLANLFRAYLNREGAGIALLERARRELRGKNLACWCPVGGPCHAEVLLDLVNR